MTDRVGQEVFFDKRDLIVSKTNLKGHITYANNIFLEIAGYTEDEVIGKPHNLIRHPDMPRCVFKLLWETLQSGKEIFAYVENKTKHGDFYWVIAHVTPSFDETGNIIGYHSTRRVPNGEVVEKTIKPLYRDLVALENSHSDRKVGMQAAFDQLTAFLAEKELDYDEFIAQLARAA